MLDPKNSSESKPKTISYDAFKIIGVITGLIFLWVLIMSLRSRGVQFPIARLYYVRSWVAYTFLPFPVLLILLFLYFNFVKKNLRLAEKLLAIFFITMTPVVILLLSWTMFEAESVSSLQTKYNNLTQSLENTKYDSKTQGEKNDDLVRFSTRFATEYFLLANASDGSKDIPGTFQKYENDELGFSFHYPSEWGQVQLESRADCRDPVPDAVKLQNPFNNLKNESGFLITFSNSSDSRIGALTATCATGRGGGPIDYLWTLAGDPDKNSEITTGLSEAPANETKDLGGGKKLAIWYVQDSYDELYLMATAGLRANDISTGIGFISPSLTFFEEINRQAIGQRYQDIANFLILIRSFELTP